MKADVESLLFLEREKNLEIPFFQRSYVWDKKNWEDLWNDLKDNRHNHYLGSLILKSHNDNDNNTLIRTEIIDGQQRLTTLSCLLKACYDSFTDEEKKTVIENDKTNSI